MKKKEKRGILILVVIAILVVVVLLVVKNTKKETTGKNNNEPTQGSNTSGAVVTDEFTETYSEGTKKNTSNQLAKEKKLGNLTISNIQLTMKDGISTILADVKNNGNEKITEKYITIKFLDKNGNEMADVPGVIANVEPGQTVQLNSSITQDITNAYDFKVEEK